MNTPSFEFKFIDGISLQESKIKIRLNEVDHELPYFMAVDFALALLDFTMKKADEPIKI